MAVFSDSFRIAESIHPAVGGQDFKFRWNYDEPSFKSADRLEQIFFFSLNAHNTPDINTHILKGFDSFKIQVLLKAVQINQSYRQVEFLSIWMQSIITSFRSQPLFYSDFHTTGFRQPLSPSIMVITEVLTKNRYDFRLLYTRVAAIEIAKTK